MNLSPAGARRRLLAAAAVGMSLLTVAGAGAASAQAAPAASEREGAQLAALRAATAKYHDVQVALADGYLPAQECAESPAGAMGYHYVKPSLFGSTDLSRPTALLYVPSPSGRLRLAGAEYLSVDADQDLSTDADRPSMFGRGFDGPMPGHEPGMPVHYDLHVWVWAHNPAGTFAAWNPALSC